MKITVIFGGSSFEHEISIISAITMKKVLEKHSKLSLSFVYVGVDSQGNREFYAISSDDMRADFFSKKAFLKCPKLFLKQGGFFQNALLGVKQIPTGVVLNLIHGRDGEDGKIAALLEFFGIPFIGPRIEGSLVSYDKELTKSFAKSRGVETLPYCVLYQEEAKDLETIQKHLEANQIHLPLIIKPARLGSSVGIMIVYEEDKLSYSLDSAFEFDHKIIIEPFIKGIKEYNLAGFLGEELEFSTIEEPQKGEFLDFEKKYLDFSRTGEVREANISSTLKQTIQENFARIYQHTFCGAIIRCDFFVKDGKCYLNEINPIPGSMANYLFRDFKKALVSLISTLPKERKIPVTFDLLHTIKGAKGGK